MQDAWLIAYDITEDKLRTKVSNRLIYTGLSRVQFSVFLGTIDDKVLADFILWFQNKILTLKIFCAKPLIILPNDINEFCSIVVKIKSTDYEGVLMRFKNGKECVVGDFNLENFRPIQTFLEETKVSFVGHYKFSFASYFFRHFRQ